MKYAELLVKLQKLMDLHVILTTHTPYFLQAMELYTAKENLAAKTKFYGTDAVDGKIQISDDTDCIDLIYDKLAEPFQKMEDAQYI